MRTVAANEKENIGEYVDVCFYVVLFEYLTTFYAPRTCMRYYVWHCMLYFVIIFHISPSETNNSAYEQHSSGIVNKKKTKEKSFFLLKKWIKQIKWREEIRVGDESEIFLGHKLVLHHNNGTNSFMHITIIW